MHACTGVAKHVGHGTADAAGAGRDENALACDRNIHIRRISRIKKV
jgi:hypothetical protein